MTAAIAATAVEGIGSAGATRAPAAIQPTQSEDVGQVSGAFRQFVDNFQSKSVQYAQETTNAAPDPVATMKNDMVAQAASGDVSSSDMLAKGANMLNRSFDHAIFVSLVSQVVGGVSQATSTLVKQG